MASTYTQTSTKTFARLELIKTQVRIAFRRSTNISKEQLNKLVDIGIDRHWLKQIKIYGIDDQGLCQAQLVLDINWNKHKSQLSMGKAKIIIDNRWAEDTAIELDESINLFNKYVNEYSLTTTNRFSLSEGEDHDIICKELNLVSAEPIKFTNKSGNSFNIPELQEVCVGFYYKEE